MTVVDEIKDNMARKLDNLLKLRDLGANLEDILNKPIIEAEIDENS